MNITLVGIDNDNPQTDPDFRETYNPSQPFAVSAQRTTLRLHQRVGAPPS